MKKHSYDCKNEYFGVLLQNHFYSKQDEYCWTKISTLSQKLVLQKNSEFKAIFVKLTELLLRKYKSQASQFFEKLIWSYYKLKNPKQQILEGILRLFKIQQRLYRASFHLENLFIFKFEKTAFAQVKKFVSTKILNEEKNKEKHQILYSILILQKVFTRFYQRKQFLFQKNLIKIFEKISHQKKFKIKQTAVQLITEIKTENVLSDAMIQLLKCYSERKTKEFQL